VLLPSQSSHYVVDEFLPISRRQRRPRIRPRASKLRRTSVYLDILPYHPIFAIANTLYRFEEKNWGLKEAPDDRSLLHQLQQQITTKGTHDIKIQFLVPTSDAGVQCNLAP
jgi:hypothetical protein